jgi:hypothetical protein
VGIDPARPGVVWFGLDLAGWDRRDGHDAAPP